MFGVKIIREDGEVVSSKFETEEKRKEFIDYFSQKEDWGKTKKIEIELLDLLKDYETQLEICYEKRVKEYPRFEELIEGMVEHIAEDRPEKLKLLQEKRLEIKKKYPKPQK